MTLVLALKPTRKESRSGIGIAAFTPLDGADAAEVLGLVAPGLLDALHAGELGRLVVGDRAGRGVADQEL